MAYTIPPGNTVAFPFASGTPYTPPLGNKVAFRFGGLPGTIFAVGFDMSLFGDASVRNATAQIFPEGWNSGFVSVNLIVTKSLMPVGIAPGGFGTPTLFNLTKFVSPTGIPAGAVGTQWVSFALRRLTVVGLGDQSRFGTAALAGGVRILDLAGRGIAATLMGNPTTWFFLRQLFPGGFNTALYGQPQVDFNHFVSPLGFGGEAFGQHEVYYPRFIVDLSGLGIASPGPGTPDVKNHIQLVAPVGFNAGGQTEVDRFGRAEIHNYIQYIQQLFEVTPSDGGVFGSFNLVDNKKKIVRPEGNVMSRHGTPDIRNNARLIATPAFQDFSVFGQHLVAAAIRFVEPVGADTSIFGSPLNTIVYNAARQLYPAGWKSEAFGTARFFANRQFMTTVGFDQSLFGTAMVAYAIRTVAPFAIPGDFPFGLTDVSNAKRFIAPLGLEAGGFGVPTLEIHFTIIKPSSTLPPSNQVGQGGRVTNKTPQIYQQGAVMTEWGNTALHNQFETYAMQGWESLLFGRHVVKDRKQALAVVGWVQTTIPLTHQVSNVNPDPPATRTIAAQGFDVGTYGRPSIRTPAFYPVGFVATAYGTPTVVSNGILPVGITPPYDEVTNSQFGVASLNRPPTAFPKGFENLTLGVPDVGPRYVWAPRGYPYQTGLWSEIGHTIDYFVHGQSDIRPSFGLAAVTLRHRILNASGTSFLGFGVPRLSLRIQYVRPSGSSFQKFGFPVLNGGGDVKTTGFDMARYGTPFVSIPDYGPKTVHPQGILGFSSPRQDVQNFNRPIFPVGWVEFRVSPPAPPSFPRVSTWISHEYPPFELVGSDMALYGTPWVSFRIRHIEPQGFDQSIVADYQPGHFSDRMRITRRDYLGAFSVGSTLAFGTPTIALWRQGLLPEGFDSAEMGGASVRRVNRVNVLGWESLIFGDVQRWEEGKIKPIGDDLALFGKAIINRVVHTQGWEGVMGTPTMGMLVNAQSFGGEQFGETTVVGNVCGPRALRANGFAAGAVGTPGVHA